MQQEIPVEQLVTKGKMVKSPFEMTKAELFAWQIQNKIDAREKLFAIGQPLVHNKDGEFVAEYPDGRIVKLR